MLGTTAIGEREMSSIERIGLWALAAAVSVAVTACGDDGSSNNTSDAGDASAPTDTGSTGSTDTMPPVGNDTATATSSGETGTGTGTGGDTNTTDSGTPSIFPLVYTFDADDGGWEGLDWADAPLDNSIWEWDSALGAWKVAWNFEYVGDNLVVENYYSKGTYPGGMDLTGISVIEYKVKTLVGDGFYDLFIQSIKEESEIEEEWIWYSKNEGTDMVANGEIVTYVFDVRQATAEELNPQEVTKFGLIVAPPEPPEGYTVDEVDAGGKMKMPLPAPHQVSVELHEVILHGPEYEGTVPGPDAGEEDGGTASDGGDAS